MSIAPENKTALEIVRSYFNADFNNYELDDTLGLLSHFFDSIEHLDTKKKIYVDFWPSAGHSSYSR